VNNKNEKVRKYILDDTANVDDTVNGNDADANGD
jgi:hypothetical protein